MNRKQMDVAHRRVEGAVRQVNKFRWECASEKPELTSTKKWEPGKVDGSQGALIQPGCFRGSLHTSASRCAHSAIVKPWISERGLGSGMEPQGECLVRGFASAKKRSDTIPTVFLLGNTGTLEEPGAGG